MQKSTDISPKISGAVAAVTIAPPSLALRYDLARCGVWAACRTKCPEFVAHFETCGLRAVAACGHVGMCHSAASKT